MKAVSIATKDIAEYRNALWAYGYCETEVLQPHRRGIIPGNFVGHKYPPPQHNVDVAFQTISGALDRALHTTETDRDATWAEPERVQYDFNIWIVRYSKFIHPDLCADLFTSLPLELRELVYSHLDYQDFKGTYIIPRSYLTHIHGHPCQPVRPRLR
jgi:hypothetical protein